MDRRQLEHFLAVAEAGSFSAAAALRGIAQPTISVSIARLEAQLELPLFHRLGRGVRLTAAGEALVGPARQVIRTFGHASDAVARVRELESGVLDLVCPPTLAVDPLARLVGDFRQRHPGVTVNVITPKAGTNVNTLVESGVAELGITVADDLPFDLVSVRYGVQVLYAFLSPEMTVSDPPTVAEVLSQGLVTTPRGGTVRTTLEELLGEPTVTAAVVVESDFEEAVIPLVQAGAGACFAPEAIAGEAARVGLVAKTTEPLLQREVFVTHRRSPLSPSAQAFVELLTA
jgi:LysR family transcriptional regulator, carnitine catabolism transcriptional activator